MTLYGDIMLIKNRYQIVGTIGSGGMGEVFQVTDLLKNDEIQALKIINSQKIDQQDVNRFKNEFLIMTKLKHPNLIRVFDFGYDKKNDIYFLVMEYIDGQPINQCFLKENLDFPECIKLMIPILQALEFIHSKNILYRDFKPENILFNEKKREIKLLDFGLSDLDKAESSIVKGTIKYLAPEVINKQNIDHRSDIFSFGIMLLELSIGQEFYSNSEIPDIITIMASKTKYEKKLNNCLKLVPNKNLAKVIAKSMAYDLNMRYNSCTEIIEALHKCFRSDKIKKA